MSCPFQFATEFLDGLLRGRMGGV